ncbi:bifunctional (p)ppGpp synthetase/guanosine-3',5'-bis(diphosphate) 3'-pyrophosphohydrolase [Bacillus sp. FJAT-42376]|uniref:HD domain-containing protein n=1 Tax=Bacillus sp. FJAT-42376 TaxID=2014076 RepID=UPI000F50B4D7|nr:HD domain-containing protein [Bacillus sp. FJAT-42376]AZB42615.1 bifunctional (p)ppGpp synthetase/guanosine-3',5'-bis(diphosphate) 3'-pyrophosphohydrolase [Bacillus sp. FJAT-42376]
MISEAKRFAEFVHRGQVRRLTGVPYFVHVENTATILLKAGASDELVAAGYLHDTVEDTDTSMEDIRSKFGGSVADLVAFNTEDKKKTWEERKQATIDHAAGASLEEKMLLAADKLDNLQSMEQGLIKYGDELWNHFSRGKEQQAWYYRNVAKELFAQLKPEEVPTYFYTLDRLQNRLF